MWKHLQVKYPQFFLDYNETRIFLTDFQKKKKAEIKSFIKIRPVGAEVFQADGRRQANGHDEVNGGVSQFCERA